MVLNKADFTQWLSMLIEKKLEEKQFGEFGFTVTMHEGTPVKLVETSTTDIKRRPEGLLEMTE